VSITLKEKSDESEKPTITSVTFWDKDNYVSFSDTDIQTDYFNSYTLGIGQTMEWVKEDGDDVILLRFGNGKDLPKYRKRLEKLAHECGYSVEEKKEERTSFDGTKWVDFWFILRRCSNG